MYLRFCALVVAMPVLASALLPGVNDKQLPFPYHSNLTGQVTILFLSSPFPQDLWGTGLESAKLQFSGTAVQKACFAPFLLIS